MRAFVVDDKVLMGEVRFVVDGSSRRFAIIHLGRIFSVFARVCIITDRN